MIQPWKQPIYWVQALKCFATLGPVMVVYAIYGTRGLEAICAAVRSKVWCDIAFIVYVVVAIAIVRIFFLWLRPKP
jgi:hypothetical protein